MDPALHQTVPSHSLASDCGAETRVLIVEDEALVAIDLKCALEELGYKVVGIAASAEDALAKATQERPDVMVTDIRLRGRSNGIEAAAQIRSRMPVSVVFLTANADAETLSWALATGPGGYITKPYNQHTLHATISVALRQQRAEQALLGERAELTHQQRALETHAQQAVKLAERYRLEATVDPLTGLYNRRHLDHVLAEQLSASRHDGVPLSIVMLDLDRFKRLNDTFGHVTGDAVLHRIAMLLHASIRPSDIACRYGGEELTVIMPGATLEEAQKMALHLRRSIEAMTFKELHRMLWRVTASFGVASFPDHGRSPIDLLSAADAALYKAKAGGRNQVVAASDPATFPKWPTVPERDEADTDTVPTERRPR